MGMFPTCIVSSTPSQSAGVWSWRTITGRWRDGSAGLGPADTSAFKSFCFTVVLRYLAPLRGLWGSAAYSYGVALPGYDAPAGATWEPF